jgi:hypothetical protein
MHLVLSEKNVKIMEKKKLDYLVALIVILYSMSLVGERQCYYIFNSNIVSEISLRKRPLRLYVTKFSLAFPFTESVEPEGED